MITPRTTPPTVGQQHTVRVFSFGGGWQSMAALVLAAQGHLPYRHFIFANVGADSEHPGTLRYIDRYARPFAQAHRIQLTEVHRIRRDGTIESIYGRLTRPNSRSLPIPVRMANGAPGTRSCTVDFKIRVIGGELKRRGASARRPATVGIGISVDEIHRANTRHAEAYEHIEYPLLKLGIRRSDIIRILGDAGLPVPPKSACWFCPFHTPQAWQAMRNDEAELFERACALEALLNIRRSELGRDPVYLTRFGVPLDRAIPAGTIPLPFDDDSEALCDSGRCMT